MPIIFNSTKLSKSKNMNSSNSKNTKIQATSEIIKTTTKMTNPKKKNNTFLLEKVQKEQHPMKNQNRKSNFKTY